MTVKSTGEITALQRKLFKQPKGLKFHGLLVSFCVIVVNKQSSLPHMTCQRPCYPIEKRLFRSIQKTLMSSRVINLREL